MPAWTTRSNWTSINQMELGCGQRFLKGPDATDPRKMGRSAEIGKPGDPDGVERDRGQSRADDSETEMSGCQSESENKSSSPG